MIDSFTTMTTIAAVLAGTSVAAIVGWWRNSRGLQECRRGQEYAFAALGNAVRARHAAAASMESMAAKLIDAEDKLRQIETKRHNSAKHARGVQLAKAKVLRDTKTSELRRDLKASLAEPERQAA